MNRSTRRAALALGLFTNLLGGPACVRRSREPLVTYFNGEYALSVRYPASWKTEQAEQDGVWYRYFLGPTSGPDKKPEVSVTLLAGPLGVPVDQYAEVYLGGNKLGTARDEERQGARGRSYVFTSPDGAMRYSLLLLAEPERVYGLYVQGDARSFERHEAAVLEMERSLTLERTALYPLVRDKDFAFSLRVPPSWREARRFAGAFTLLLQYTSPPLGADKGGQTVHASLTLTVEPLGPGGNIDSLYEASRAKLGDAFPLLSHAPWPPSGYVDVMRSETPVTVSRVKRYYRAVGGRGYSLTFETREDAFSRVFRWYDLIAATFKAGPEAEP